MKLKKKYYYSQCDKVAKMNATKIQMLYRGHQKHQISLQQGETRSRIWVWFKKPPDLVYFWSHFVVSLYL